MADLLKIKTIAEEKNISLKEVAESIGITPTGLSKIIRENSTKTTTLEKIAIKLKVPVGIFFDEDSQAQPQLSPQDHNLIPLVNLEAIGGFGSMNFAIKEQDIQSLYEVPDFININFMIRVKGSSMYPKYNSGDVVACRIIRESRFIQWNKVHVLATAEQGILIKRLKKGADKNNLLAISDNKDYDPFEIPKDEITGIALVVGVIRLE